MEEQALQTENKFNIKDRLNYLYFALAYFFAVPLANICLVFKPLYKKVYYGQANDIFYYGLSTILLGIFVALIELVLRKKLNISLKTTKKELPLRNTIILYVLTLVIVFIISAVIGFHVKPFYDLGNNTTGFRLVVKGVEALYIAVVAIFMTRTIAAFQYTFDGLFNFNNPILNKYFPYGGICTMILMGTYFIITSFTSLLYIFVPLILVYGIIYLIAERSFIKTFASIVIIMLL